MQIEAQASKSRTCEQFEDGIGRLAVGVCYGSLEPSLKWKTLLAFAIIYFVVGSHFLVIRVGVREVPPFLLWVMRFLVAGLFLYGLDDGAWRALTERSRQWASVSFTRCPDLRARLRTVVLGRAALPSGIAAVMLATIPVFMALSEIFLLATQKLTARLALAPLIGIGGVVLPMSCLLDIGGAPIDLLGAVALIFAAISWSVASRADRASCRCRLPKS